MGDLLSKFEMLDNASKQQLLDYLDFLLSKTRKKFSYEAYRKRILTVGTWTDEDIKPIEEANQLIDNWNIKGW